MKKEFHKHLVIHADIIVGAETKREAQKIYEEAELLLNQENIRFDGELIDEETNWKTLKR